MAFSITRNVNAMPIIFDGNSAPRIELTPSAPHRWGSVKSVFDVMYFTNTPQRDHGLHIYHGLTLDHRGNPLVVVCRMRDGSLRAFISSEYVAINKTHLDYIKHGIYRMGVKRGCWEEKTQVELMAMFTTSLAITMEDLLPEGQKAISKAFLMAETELLKPKAVVILPVADPTDVSNLRSIRLEDCTGNKLQTLKLYKELTGLGLKEAKDIIDSAPVNLFTGISIEAAVRILEAFEEVGTLVTIIGMPIPPKVMGIKPKTTQTQAQAGWGEFFKDLDSVNVPTVPVEPSAILGGNPRVVDPFNWFEEASAVTSIVEALTPSNPSIWIDRATRIGGQPLRSDDQGNLTLGSRPPQESARIQRPQSSNLTEEERILQDQLDAEIQNMI